MTRVLVTGATGFIGNHLVKHLSQAGSKVTCLVRKTSNTSGLIPWGPELRFGDICDAGSLANAVRDADVVVHLAGLTRSLRRKQLDIVNGLGTANLIESCLRRESPPIVVLVSSLAAAGPAPRSGRLRVEQDSVAPVSNYGCSKLLGEQLATRMAAGRLPLSIVRPPIVFGEGDRDCLKLFEGIADWGVHLVPTRNDYPFSLIHASDLANALTKVATTGQRVRTDSPESGTYFISANEHPTYARLGSLIGVAVGQANVRIVRSHEILVKALGASSQLIGWLCGKTPVLNLDKAREAVAGSWACCNSKLNRDTGFVPAKPLLTRLRQTAEWYAANGMLKIDRRRTQRAIGPHWSSSILFDQTRVGNPR